MNKSELQENLKGTKMRKVPIKLVDKKKDEHNRKTVQ